MYHGGGSPPYLKMASFLDPFWPILLYFQASGISPIDPARRELQNAIGEIEIGDFFDF